MFAVTAARGARDHTAGFTSIPPILSRRLVENGPQNPHSGGLQLLNSSPRSFLASGLSLENEHDAIHGAGQRNRFVARIERCAIDQNVVEIRAQFLQTLSHA